jgi:hypothetical protein
MVFMLTTKMRAGDALAHYRARVADGVTKSRAARETGWSREHLHRLDVADTTRSDSSGPSSTTTADTVGNDTEHQEVL